MKSMLKWGLLAAVLAAFVGAAVPAHAMTCPAGKFDLNKCTAGKIKCVLGKKSCLFGCYKKAAGGVLLDQACLAKCRSKFDGAGVAAKSCFGKLDLKAGNTCLTTGDSDALENKIDGYVQSAINDLQNTAPVGIGNKCLAGKINCLIGYNKCRLGIYGGAAGKGLSVSPIDATLAGKIQGCTDKIKSCYSGLESKPPCLTTGDASSILQADNLFIDDVTAELTAGQKDMNTQRCTGDTSVKCTNAPGGSGQCGAGTCEFFFGSNLPLSAGGVATCVTNQWDGGITGTANIETGESGGSAKVIAKVYNGLTLNIPCPRCINDYVPNDGNDAPCAGTCAGGARNGQPCDINGVSPNPDFGATSMDCPPDPGALISTLPINLSNTNSGTVAITLSASSPNCNANAAVGKKCACSSCSGNSLVPCRFDADCILAGAGTCTNNAGEPKQPNACLPDTFEGQVCTDAAPVGDGEGECADGPVDQNCAIETQRGCTTATQATDCPAPGDSCLSHNRRCYLDNGLLNPAGQIEAQGKHAAPINHWSHPTFASVFCVAPTASSSVNIAAGLPGAGRLELDGEAVDNGTDTTCPTQATFLPTAKGGVLDTGWKGNAHNANVIGQGKVTVNLNCSSGVPPCGVCGYTGPIPNANVAP